MATRRTDLALPLEIVDWLLTGDLRSGEEIDRLHAAGVSYDGFRQFDSDWPPADLGELWRTHRGALLLEAARRGIQQPWAVTQGFDA
jgi:hypothetical protein